MKFRYNPETCRYEPFYVKGQVLWKRAFIFLCLSLIVAVAGYFYINQYFETVDELLLEKKNHTLKVQWDVLHQRVQKAEDNLMALVEKDDHNYRVILDSSPLDSSIREAGVGGSERINHKILKDFPTILQEYMAVEKLQHQVAVEIQSFDEINRILEQKNLVWAHKPAIQPLNNKEVLYLHTKYGPRKHPVLGFVRDHKGLDFTADVGTPVYATGDGKIKSAYQSESLGNVVFIDHRYGYETRYAHLSKYIVKAGEYIKRGEIIGYVGNTGLSAGPHLHYEVLFQGKHINPINFFQRDLNNEEYERLIELASQEHDALD